MTTKLNLTINEKTAKAIKVYAEKKKTSVSKIAEDYFSKLAKQEIQIENNDKSFVAKYAGIATAKIPIDIEIERDAYLIEKHGI